MGLCLYMEPTLKQGFGAGVMILTAALFNVAIYIKIIPFYFPRYEMSNCLFEASYEEVLAKCNCTPSFHQTGISEYPRICTGTKLKCMTQILHRIGKYNSVSFPGHGMAFQKTYRSFCSIKLNKALNNSHPIFALDI